MEPEARRVTPGRLPERVYWIRRAIVVVGLALVIALVMWLVSLGSPQQATPSTTTPAPATTSAPPPPDSVQATALPAPVSSTSITAATTTDRPTTAAPSSAAAPPACDPAALTLSLTAPGSVKVGATAQFTVKVTNAAVDACTFTFDSRFALTIVSGTDEIWSTTDCAQWGPTGSQSLAGGAAATWQPTWDRHRSQATCKVVPTTLKSGTYVATAAYTGATSAEVAFLLTA